MFVSVNARGYSSFRSYIRAAFMVNTDKEYMAGLKYIAGKILVSQHYDSDMGIGFG
jgi:hypothetical protein